MGISKQSTMSLGIAAIFGAGAAIFNKSKQKGFAKKHKKPIFYTLAGLSAYNGVKGVAALSQSSNGLSNSLSNSQDVEQFTTDLPDGTYKGIMSGWNISVEGRNYKVKSMGIKGRSPITAIVKNGILTYTLDR